jgi:hypothetical protein
LSTVRVPKVATPLTAVTVVVPQRVPPPGLSRIATVMLLVAPVTVFPDPSWIATTTAGLIAAPAVTLVGWTVKASAGAGGLVDSTLPHADPTARGTTAEDTAMSRRAGRAVFITAATPFRQMIGQTPHQYL